MLGPGAARRRDAHGPSSSSPSPAARRCSTPPRPRCGLGPTPLDALRDELRRRRDQLCAGLRAAGLTPLAPQGTYFVNADVGTDAVRFCAELPERSGVVGIPTSVFYDDKDAARDARALRVLQAARR